MILTVHAVQEESIVWYKTYNENGEKWFRWRSLGDVVSIYYLDSAYSGEHIDYVPLTELIIWLFDQGIVLDWSQVPDRYLPKEIER